MKLPGRVEDHLSPGQVVFLFPGGDADIALIYIDKFPKIMGLTGKGIVAGVFKIVDGK